MDNEQEDIFMDLGVEIELKNEDDFLKIRETLTRMGVSSRKDRKLYQSCHILHKRGQYAIMHFKEMFVLDGLESNLDENEKQEVESYINFLITEGHDIETIADAYTLIVKGSFKEELYFREKGKYRHSLFSEVEELVYNNHDFMKHYLTKFNNYYFEYITKFTNHFTKLAVSVVSRRVPRAGLEPARDCCQRILSPLNHFR